MNSGAHSGRAVTSVRSPSARTFTRPAGTSIASMSRPSRRSHAASPTVGWPANGSSFAGVKIRAVADLPMTASTKTVSLKPRSDAILCS